jgi:Uma2 family endonuclease
LTQLPESLVYIEGGYQLRSGRWLQPDVSVQRDGQPVENDYLQGSPRLAIEIVSKTNRMLKKAFRG